MVRLTQEAGTSGDDRPPTLAEIGRALSLTRQAVHKLRRQGMPVHSIEAAHAWRRDHLNPARRKRGGFDDELRTRELVARANSLMTAAAGALGNGLDVAFDALVPALRQALQDVPERARDRVALSPRVMSRLTAPVLELIGRCMDEDRAEAAEAGVPAPDFSGTGAGDGDDGMGAFWYSMAAGEGIAVALRHLEPEAAPRAD